MGARGTIVVAGSLAQKPGHGGHTWVFLQYLLGFRRLGWDVLFLDRLPDSSTTAATRASSPSDHAPSLHYFREVMARFNLGKSYALFLGDGQQCLGIARAEVLRRVRQSAILLNVMGFLRDEEILSAAPRRVFLDIDPGFGQMWKELGLADVFQGHDTFVTIGENIGRPACSIPSCGLNWITTPQPVVLEHWPVATGSDSGRLTSVASWRGAYGPVEYGGMTYGLRVHEFRKFAALPLRTGFPCQLALDIHPSETRDRTLLAANGWELVDPRQVAGDPERYRNYVRDSRAEFMAAKGMYVQARSGWLSDRSLCYLASGRPVLAQDTGLRQLYPTGEGLLTFTTLEEAAAGAETLMHDYPRHARVARALAEEFFESDKVLGRLLAKLGVA
jgi:hypothetical protein